ncbi:MAG: DUF805 domain-containing protein [Undibacterium sp.]|nr:DUF805 domain-containing protein [Undibacterium sp.]
MENVYSAPQADLSRAPTDGDPYQPRMWSVAGRIGRVRYLAYSMAASLLFMLIFAIFLGIFFTSPAIAGIGLLLMYLPMIAIGFVFAKRRLNDLDQSGWLSLLMIIPFVNFILWLFLVFGSGTPTSNRYGARPTQNSTLEVVGACVMPLIMVVGILAAIALPAYQQYVQKAKAAQTQQAAPAPSTDGQ